MATRISPIAERYREQRILKQQQLRKQFGDKLRSQRMEKDKFRQQYRAPMPPTPAKTKYLDRYVSLGKSRRSMWDRTGSFLLGYPRRSRGREGQPTRTGTRKLDYAATPYYKGKPSSYERRKQISKERQSERAWEMGQTARAQQRQAKFGPRDPSKTPLMEYGGTSRKYKLWYPELDFAGLGLIPPVFLLNKVYDMAMKPISKAFDKYMDVEQSPIKKLAAGMARGQLENKTYLGLWGDKPGSIFDTSGAYPSGKVEPLSDPTLYSPGGGMTPLSQIKDPRQDPLGLRAQDRAARKREASDRLNTQLGFNR
jgi:hypothetical protein